MKSIGLIVYLYYDGKRTNEQDVQFLRGVLTPEMPSNLKVSTGCHFWSALLYRPAWPAADAPGELCGEPEAHPCSHWKRVLLIPV